MATTIQTLFNQANSAIASIDAALITLQNQSDSLNSTPITVNTEISASNTSISQFPYYNKAESDSLYLSVSGGTVNGNVTVTNVYASGSLGIGTAETTAAQLTVTGSSSIASIKLPNIKEVANIYGVPATGTINYDITNQSIVYFTTNASGNWTINFRASSGTSLNTLMSIGESMSATFLATQGATAYYNNVIQIDGTTSGVTTKYQNGIAPTSGNINSIDVYMYNIIKTGSSTYTVLVSQTKFA